jgi:hypothetical protein
MVGLDAAGKTTILYKLKLGEIVTTIPTIGEFLDALFGFSSRRSDAVAVLPRKGWRVGVLVYKPEQAWSCDGCRWEKQEPCGVTRDESLNT